MPILLGKINTPLDWSELQFRARRSLGRTIQVACAENRFCGEKLTRTELAALGFRVAADPSKFHYAAAIRVFGAEDN